MPPIHPEGEDEKGDPIGAVQCPNCGKSVFIPELANIDVFVCPECGQRIRLPRRSELRP